ncbi:MAG: OmpH family outer membrane protein [Planctomycetaceae bacterium]|jgi:Skp family chaperone for outer membrane proteins|nr:OmpH family outer membrane protein [Planctomycetaceae bacterium]
MRILAGFIGWCVVVVGSLGATMGQTPIVAIDMGAVFESHPLFVSQLEALKQEIRQFEEDQNRQREALQAKFQTLRGQDASSESFRQTEADIAGQVANLDVQKRLRSKEYAQKEAKIYYDIYTDVSSKVTAYCQHHGLTTVIHYNSRPMDLNNPATIMERIGSNVVYARPDWEITAAIKQLCTGPAQTARTPGNVQPSLNR